MLFFPEVRLQRICKYLIDYLIDNYKRNLNNQTENQSYLYLLFHKDSDDENMSNFYEQAKTIFLREQNNPRFLQINPMWDKKRAGLPTISIITSPDNENYTQIGDFEGGDYNGVISRKLERGYQSQFVFMITSENINEVLIITYTLRALLISSIGELAGLGFINPILGVQDIIPQIETFPTNIYSKNIVLNTTYTEQVPELIGLEEELHNVIFNFYKITI